MIKIREWKRKKLFLCILGIWGIVLTSCGTKENITRARRAFWDTVTLDRNQKSTEEQIKQIEEAAKREIVFDEDSPELTPAMEKAFRLAAKNRNTQRNMSVS